MKTDGKGPTYTWKGWEERVPEKCPDCGGEPEFDVLHVYDANGELDRVKDVVDCAKCGKELWVDD